MPVLPLFPMHVVVFPGQRQQLHIFEPRYRRLVREVLDEEAPFGIVLIKRGREVGGGAVPVDTGCAVRIREHQELEDGRYNLLCEGTQRFRIRDLLGEEPFLRAEVEFLPEPEDASDEATQEAAAGVAEQLAEHMRLVLALQDGWQREFRFPAPPARLADHAGARLEAPAQIKQQVLEAPTVGRRLELLSKRLQIENRVLAERVVLHRRQKLAGLGVLN